MSKLLEEYALLEAERKRIDERIAKLKNDDRLKADMQFKKDIQDVLDAHGKSESDLIALFTPSEERPAKPRKRRPIKVYKNPHTGVTEESRGGNNKTLKEWKDQHGAKVVEGWVVELREV